MDYSSVHTTAQGQSSFPTSAVPSLHHRSKCAHHHPNTMQCLPSVHCHRTNTITHLSLLCFPGRKTHIHLLVGSHYPKYNLGFHLLQVRQVSNLPTPKFPHDLLTLPKRPYRIALAAHSSKGYLLLCNLLFIPLYHFKIRSEESYRCAPLYFWCGMLPSIGILGLHSLPHSFDGFRAAPHPNSVSFYRWPCHAALLSLSLLLATVLTDSVIYICCDATGCFLLNLLTCCIVFFCTFWPNSIVTS